MFELLTFCSSRWENTFIRKKQKKCIGCCLFDFPSNKLSWGKCLSGLWQLAVFPIVFCWDNIQAVNAINLGDPWENWFLSRHLWDNAKLPSGSSPHMTGGNDDKCYIMTTVHWYLGIVAHTSQLSFYQDSLLDNCSWRSSNNSLTFLQTGPIRRQVKMLQLIQCQAMASL